MSKAEERATAKARAEMQERANRCNAELQALLKRHNCRLVTGLVMSEEGGMMPGMAGTQFTLTIVANPKG